MPSDTNDNTNQSASEQTNQSQPGNTAVNTPTAAPTSGVNGDTETTPGTNPDVAGAHNGTQPDAPNANADKDGNPVQASGSNATADRTDSRNPQASDSNDNSDSDTNVPNKTDAKPAELSDDLKLNELKDIAAKEGVKDHEQFNKPGTSKADVRKAIEDHRNDPNQSSDPDFNPDTQNTNPDAPVSTDVEAPKPLDGDSVPVSESEKAGAPLGANATDDNVLEGKRQIIASAKRRVREQNPNLEKADPAAYRDAVTRAVADLTNGDPEAARAITKHWSDQQVAA